MFVGFSRSLRSIAQSVGLEIATNKEERLMLLEAWQGFEFEYGDEASRSAVVNLMPKRVKKRRRIQTQDGVRKTIVHFARTYFDILIQNLERCWLGRIL